MNSTILMQQLKSPDPAQRQEAIVQIGNSFDTELLVPLAELAAPDSPEIESLFTKYLQNLPLDTSLSHLLSMSRSPNDATRNNVFATLDQIDWEQDPEIIKKILAFDYEPLILFVLDKLESSKRGILLSIVAPLLTSPSREVSETVFKLITNWNFPSSIPLLLPLLKSQQGFRKLLAITALGRLSAFRKWKRLRPFIKSPEPAVRQIVVQSISLCGGTSPKAFFLKALKRETDASVIKELITALKGAQSGAVIRELIRLAALHTEPGVRKTANWAVNECRGKTLQKSIKRMLNPKKQTLCSFLITKIGELQITELGHLVVSFLNTKAPAPLRCAALESLCLLKDKKYIDRLSPYIKSPDSMEAYLGTLAAANTVSSIDECRELKDIFLSSAPEHTVLKQILLELMNGPMSWDPADESIQAALKANLNSEDSNTRYLSLFLIKRTKDHGFIPILTQKAAEDPDQDVRETVVKCIDTLLRGDLAYYLEILAGSPQEQERRTLTLVLKLDWDRKNALKAITFFAGERWQKADQLMRLAAKIYTVCPGEIEDFVRIEQKHTPWLFALTSACLANINPLNTEVNKKRWLTLLHKRIPELQTHLIQKVVDNKSKWAIEHLQHSLDFITDPAIARLTKNTVKKLIEL